MLNALTGRQWRIQCGVYNKSRGLMLQREWRIVFLAIQLYTYTYTHHYVVNYTRIRAVIDTRAEWTDRNIYIYKCTIVNSRLLIITRPKIITIDIRTTVSRAHYCCMRIFYSNAYYMYVVQLSKYLFDFRRIRI